ncbi:putative integral membrane protein [Babesia bovis T2Bo]|uniref:putative integral membrane protein n=1 Tax=Babesia bovis T2Bo TaxID=484906 RepID=UPI001C36D34F|nr:putative integral membrane protein [Babesia bovis T2Bo]KAG6440230.1 putative integral membrane protein [Babesia bovis T2Bo]
MLDRTMVGLSFVTVAICYFGSFAIANKANDKRTLKEDLMLFDKLLCEKSADNMKQEIGNTLKKDKEKTYSYIKEFYDRIKKNCNILTTEINDHQLSSDSSSGNLLTELKDLLKLLEDKCKSIRAIALRTPDDQSIIANWLVDFGVVEQKEDVKTSVNRDHLKRCYRSFYHHIDGLEKVLGIVDRAESRNADKEDADADYYGEDEDEANHEDCSHPEHHGHQFPGGKGPGSNSDTISSSTQDPAAPGPVTTDGHLETPAQPSATAAPSGTGSKNPAQEPNNIRGPQPPASQQSQAYIPLFATAVATVLVSVF